MGNAGSDVLPTAGAAGDGHFFRRRHTGGCIRHYLTHVRLQLLGAGVTLLTLLAASWAGITGSSHDFSKKNWNPRGETCTICHAGMHEADNNVAPLWSHSTTTASFTPYQSASLRASVGQPTGASLACLSCHDGTIAINSFGGSKGNEFITGSALVGTNLRKDHPISFMYDSALAARADGLHDPATRTIPELGGTTIQKAMLEQGQLQCTSCHDVHRIRGDSGSEKHCLVIKNEGDKLCMACHNK